MNKFQYNKSNFEQMWYVFILGGLYAYKKEWVDLACLEYFLFRMSSCEAFEKIGINTSLIKFIEEGMQISDVEEGFDGFDSKVMVDRQHLVEHIF